MSMRYFQPYFYIFLIFEKNNNLQLFQALVSISQPDHGKVWLEGPKLEKYGQTDTSLGLWSECDSVGDHVTVYDGPGVPGTDLPPPLIRLCRGGVVPEIVSSGPDMLLVFRTSPFSVPTSSPFSLAGFLLDVNIKFVDSDVGGILPRDKTTGNKTQQNKS